MYISASFHAIPDAFDKVTAVLKDQFIRVKFQCCTDTQAEDRRAVGDLSAAVFKVLILLKG